MTTANFYTSMDYTYKILRSSKEFNVMEVEFSAVDCETVVAGMPLPVEGQNYVDIIKAYAPTHHWTRAKQVTVDVPVGEVGTLNASPQQLPTTQQSVISPVITPDERAVVELRAQIQHVLADMAGSVV
jgi:hypothetical protein